MAKRSPEPWYNPPAADEFCALCGRLVPASQRDEHHLVPKSKGGKDVAVLHRVCHRQLHALFSESQLAKEYSTVQALLANDDVRKFVDWVKTKPPGFYERSRRSAAKR
jgi:hypothetical protein